MSLRHQARDLVLARAQCHALARGLTNEHAAHTVDLDVEQQILGRAILPRLSRHPLHQLDQRPQLRCHHRQSASGGDKRDLILKAATKVFAQNGYFQSQVADVARVAGVAAGTVYLYFRSKDDLLVSIFEKTMREAIQEGRASVEPLKDPIERLAAIARVHLDRMGRDRSLAVVFQVELRQSTKFMERFSSTLLREYLGIIRGIIAAGQASGAFRKELNATLASKLFFGGLDEMATNWILSRRKYALAGEADAIVDIFVGGLCAPVNGRAEKRRRGAR